MVTVYHLNELDLAVFEHGAFYDWHGDGGASQPGGDDDAPAGLHGCW